MKSSEQQYAEATIGAVVCALVFPVVQFAVLLAIVGTFESLGRNANPVAGMMYLRVGMTRAYPALLLFTFIFGLPIIWRVRERALRPARIFAVGTLISFVIAAGIMWSVGLFDSSLVLATFNTGFLAAPLLLCFCLFAGWVWRLNSRYRKDNAVVVPSAARADTKSVTS